MIVTSGLGAICIVADHTSKAKRILFLGTVHTTLHLLFLGIIHTIFTLDLQLEVGGILGGSLFKNKYLLNRRLDSSDKT